MDEHFVREAVALAIASVSSGGGPFGAIVVREGLVLGRGTNRVTLHRDPTAHAEVMAIRDACAHVGDFRLDGCTLYVSCLPCTMCLAASYWAHITRIFYAARAEDAASVGFDDVTIATELRLPANRRQLPLIHVPVPDGLAPFEAWAHKGDKIPY